MSGRTWNDMHAAYYPSTGRVLLWVTPLSFAVGFGGALLGYQLLSWPGMAIAVVLTTSFAWWLGGWAVARQWERWRRENPERPYHEWQREPSS